MAGDWQPEKEEDEKKKRKKTLSLFGLFSLSVFNQANQLRLCETRVLYINTAAHPLRPLGIRHSLQLYFAFWTFTQIALMFIPLSTL